MEDQQSIRIDQYLSGEMNDQDKILFEQELEQNENLAQEYKLNKNFFALYKTEDWTSIKKLNSLGSSYKNFLTSTEAQGIHHAIASANKAYKKNNYLNKRKYQWFAIASSFMIMIAVGITLMFNNSSENREQLYAEYSNFSSLPSLTFRSDADKLLSDAEELFLKKEYRGALHALELHQEKYNTTPTPYINLYKGICYLETNQYTQAKNAFNSLLNSNLLDAKKAHWFLALTHLKQGNIKSTKKELETISNNQYFNTSKAKELLDQLN